MHNCETGVRVPPFASPWRNFDGDQRRFESRRGRVVLQEYRALRRWRLLRMRGGAHTEERNHGGG